jgi:putative peptide zinc metalloprotease protein
VFLTLAIALYIGTQFFFIGVILALWAVVMMSVVPIVKAARALASLPEARERRSQVLGILGAAGLALVLLVVALPLPLRTQAEGIVWLPEKSIVRAGAPGFFRAFEAQPGSQVKAGAVLARSTDPALDAQVRLLGARIDELEASYAAEFVADRPRAQIVREQLLHEQAALARAQQRASALTIFAAASGHFTVPEANDLPGRYLQQGSTIGYILVDEAPVVRVVLDQATVDAVASSTQAVEMRLAGAMERVLRGQIVRQTPSGTDQVPSQALTLGGGGHIPVDPRDPQGRRTLERVFELDVAVPQLAAGEVPFGQRVHLRFSHPAAPLAVQAWHATRRLFLRHFDV